MRFYFFPFILSIFLLFSCDDNTKEAVVYGTNLPKVDSEIEEFISLNSDTKKFTYRVIIQPKYTGYSDLKVKLSSKNTLTNKPQIKTAKGKTFDFNSEISLQSLTNENHRFYFTLDNLSEDAIKALKNNQITLTSLFKNFTFSDSKEFALSYKRKEEGFDDNSVSKGKILSSIVYDFNTKVIAEPILRTPLPESFILNNDELTILGLDKNKAKIILDKVNEYGHFGIKDKIIQFEPIYDSQLLGYVGPVKDFKKWVLAVNYPHSFVRSTLVTKDNLKSDESYIHTIIHELSHIFTLQKSNVSDYSFFCSTYKALGKCVNENSLIGKFYTKFWKNKKVHSILLGDVVTTYAGTNINEDIAETIVYYLRLKDLPLDKNKYTQLRHKKLRFLHADAKLKELRDSKIFPIDDNLSVEPANKTGQKIIVNPLALQHQTDHKSCLNSNLQIVK